MKLAIVGSRHYKEFDKFRLTVHEFIQKHGKPEEIISGGAKGVDTMAEEYAKMYAYPIKIFEAHWNVYGKAAGPIRNKHIVDRADHILAFLAKGSKGTANTIAQARMVDVPVTIIHI